MLHTLEQVKRMWNWLVLRFCRILDKLTIVKGFDFVADIANLCDKKQPNQEKTMLSAQAEVVLGKFNDWLVSQNEFLDGYLAA